MSQTVDQVPRLLLLDDDPDVLVGTQKYFTGLGYTVHCAAERAAAETLALYVGYDCVIVDLAIEVPQGTDGFEILPFLRARSPIPKIVVLTGNGAPGLRETALRQGADAFMSKPHRLPALGKVVRDLLAPATT